MNRIEMYAARTAAAGARRATAPVARMAFVPSASLTHALTHTCAPATHMHISAATPALARLSAARVSLERRAWVRWQSQQAGSAEGMSTEPPAEESTSTHTHTDGSSAPEDPVKALQAEVLKLKQALTESNSARLRMLADMENVRTIAKRDVDTAKAYAIQSLAKRLVDVVDILGSAVGSVPADFRSKEAAAGADASRAPELLVNLYTGVAATERSLLKTLKEVGIEPFGAPGEKFDPNRHEALLQTPAASDADAGNVSQVLKIGYKIKDRILRAAQVAVATKQ